MPIQFRGQSTVSAERRDSPHTAPVHSSESKIFGPIFGQLTLLLYLEPFFGPAAKGAGQGTEWTGQVGSHQDCARETCPRLTFFSPHGTQPGVTRTAWHRNGSSLNVTCTFS